MINRQVMGLLCGTLLMGCTTEAVVEPTVFVVDTFTKVKVFKFGHKEVIKTQFQVIATYSTHNIIVGVSR